MNFTFRWFAASIALAACVHVPTPGLLTAQRIDWNPGHAVVGHVTAVSEDTEGIFVTGDQGAWFFSGGAAVSHDPSVPSSVDSDSIPSTTGEGTWLAVVGADGHVRRLVAGRSLEDITGRYGLVDAHVRAIAGAGRSVTGFVLDRSVAVSDGASIARYDCGTCTVVAGGGGRVASLGGGTVRVYDPARHQRVDYRVPGARWIAVDARGRLAVATPDAVWFETDAASLRRVFDSPDGALHGLAASRRRVWFAVGAELGVVDDASVSVTHGAGLSASARLIGARGGDVWSLADGVLERYGAAVPDPAGTWDAGVHGVFIRACTRCHTAGGPGGLDLSVWPAWTAHREDITGRVLRRRDMPPPGNDLSADDRAILERWLTGAVAPTTGARSP